MGYQVLFTATDEGGDHPCLDLVPGRVRKLPSTNGGGTALKIPHMGWNQVAQSGDHPVFAGIPDGSYFYFVHSYYPDPDDESVVIGRTDYGVTFASAIARNNLVATQFHPEKSGAAGPAAVQELPDDVRVAMSQRDDDFVDFDLPFFRMQWRGGGRSFAFGGRRLKTRRV